MALSLEEADKLIDARKQVRYVKAEICKQCRKNFELEKEVRFFDQRIALLISHRISVEDFPDAISFGEHRVGVLKDDLQKQNFGNLFFLLQTEPRYVAKLTRAVSLAEIDELLQTVMFSLYGNQYEAREEHLLLKMFELALNIEFNETEDFNSLMRSNTAISRMMTTYTRRGPGQKYIQQTLGPLIEELFSGLTMNLEINPAKIYAEVRDIDDDEKNNITMEAALTNPSIANIVNQRLKMLQEVSDKFLSAIMNSLKQVPYGIRWLCKAIKQLCRQKFWNVSEENVVCLIGGFFLLRYINPAIVTPHAYMLSSHQPRVIMRRNLVLIAKIIQAVSNKATTQALKEQYMQPLEDYVKRKHKELQVFLDQLCNVEDFHPFLEIEHFLSLPKDAFISITLKEMYRLHELLDKYRDKVILYDNDKMSVVLSELGAPIPLFTIKEDIVADLPLVSRWDKAPELRTESGDDEKSIEYGIHSLRCQCRKILMRLFEELPSLLKENSLAAMIEACKETKEEELIRLTDLASSHLESLANIDNVYNGQDFFNSVKETVIELEQECDRLHEELINLRKVYESLCWHGDFLSQQLEAYKEYLTAVRNKAASRMSKKNKPASTKQLIGPVKFQYTVLEKEGIIIESNAIGDHRKSNIFLTILSPEPGIYKIALHYKVPVPGYTQKLEMELHLEDLLELQHFRDPVLNLNEFVLLDVRRTLSFLQKNFSSR